MRSASRAERGAQRGEAERSRVGGRASGATGSHPSDVASRAERGAQRGEAERSARRELCSRRRAQAGFTLIEVLLAVLLLGLVVGSLVVSVQQNLVALVGARAELERVRLAEAGLRDLEQAIASGTAPEPGNTHGTFEAPDDGYAWTLAIEPYSVPLPADAVRDPPVSSVFTGPTNPTPGVEPSVLRVEYRVFPVEGMPEDAEPFVLLLVEPLPAELAGAGAEAGATGESGNGAETDGATRRQREQLRRAAEQSSR